MAAWLAIVPRCGVLKYSLRDLTRNPRRTLASVVGVALAVGLFSSTAFFVDGSASRMTERAIAPVAIDLQADLTAPLGSSLTLAETISGGPALAAGQTATVTLVITNTSGLPATALVVQDRIPTQLAYVPGSTTLNGKSTPHADGESPMPGGLKAGSLAAGGSSTVTYQLRSAAAVPVLAGIPLRGTVVSAEDPIPAAANGLPAVSLSQLGSRAAAGPGAAEAVQ